MIRLALGVLVSLLLAVSATAGGAPKVKSDRPSQERKIWTSEGVEALRTKGIISLVGLQSAAAAAEETAATEKPSVPLARPVQEKDPEWYAEQVAKIREEIAPLDLEIRYIRSALASRRTVEGGINLDRENPGITPESSIWVLENRKRELAARLDALEDQAHRNGILPGALR